MIRKVCKSCGIEKRLQDFYKFAAMADGHLNHCKQCKRQYAKDNRELKFECYQAKERERGMLPHRVAARAAYIKTERGRAAKRRADRFYRLTKKAIERATGIV